MATPRTIPAEDRDFLQQVSQAAFTNPFSEQRTELDRRIAGSVGGGDPEEVLRRAIGQVQVKVSALRSAGLGHLRHFRGEDQVLMRTVFLFEVFHRYMERFDDLIRDQEAAGDAPCTVEFGTECLGVLARRGFSSEEALRFFSLFYQLRRAYYFTEQGLVGGSGCLRQLREHLWDNVFTHRTEWYATLLWDRMEDFSTLLLGETGTGKGAAAAAIGRSGFIPYDERRRCFAESFTRNFIAINLSQYPEALIESELFGHRKGAFTGAVEDHEGLFSRCTPHGSIFLDEIGDVSVPVQIKLLQVLQERTFSKVGSHQKERFRGRVIAATNRPLDDLRRGGSFRDDFYYRLSSDVVVVPPLRQRLAEAPGEMEQLLGHLVRRTVGIDAPEVVDTVRAALDRDLPEGYAWPGNVRELEQAVRRVLLTSHYRGDMGPRTSPELQEQLLASVEAGSLDAQQLLSGYCALLHSRLGTYEGVARVTGLDRRTVKKYVLAAGPAPEEG